MALCFQRFALCFVLFGVYLVRAGGAADSGTEQYEAEYTQPLILTPYVESGRIKEGQDAARVDWILKNVKSYSGYFTVNTTENRNLFFWYFPAEESSDTAPVMIWLQGGPGSSSMYGLLMENGPFQNASDGTLVMRPYRWSKNHHVIYIDSPSGTGYSFPSLNYTFGEQQISSDLHSLLEQFFQLFPNLVDNDFYVAGESYGGYYVPSTAYAIHNRNPSSKVKINLRGLLIGNGIINYPPNVSADYFTQLGLPTDTACYNYIDFGDGNEDINSFFNEDQVKEKIHVGDQTFVDPAGVLVDDSDYELPPVLKELLMHYDILYYNGQLDCSCPYPYVEQFLSTFEWSGSSEYRHAKRVQWKVDGELAGYVKTGGNLTLVLVRNAGHMVPKDQSKWALDLVSRFTKKSLPQS